MIHVVLIVEEDVYSSIDMDRLFDNVLEHAICLDCCPMLIARLRLTTSNLRMCCLRRARHEKRALAPRVCSLSGGSFL